MSIDETEQMRRDLIAQQQQELRKLADSLGGQLTEEAVQAYLTACRGLVFNTEQLGEHFEVTGFMAPFVHVKRKLDGKKLLLEFTHMPRFYFYSEPVELLEHLKLQLTQIISTKEKDHANNN